MDLSLASTPLAAFGAGLAASIHCTAMCGPLACAVRAKPRIYHASRICSYTLGGALCGGAGETAARILRCPPLKIAPWLLAALLVMLAFGLERKAPSVPFLSKALLRARLRNSLGLLTPLIPCGPLWLIFGIAVATSSWRQGAAIAGSFAAGTVPLYWLAQHSFFALQQRLTPSAIHRLQAGLALLSAVLLAWRASLPGHACCF